MNYQIILNESPETAHYAKSFHAARKLVRSLKKASFKVYSAIIVDLRTQTEYIL